MKSVISKSMRAPVSVIIPCYRASATIERALQSVANQTLLPEEVILVDDYSEDGSYEFLEILSKQFEHVNMKLYQLPHNQGPGIARNLAWDHATQPWIAFLDSDDTWHPRKIEIQYSWISKNKDAQLCGHKTGAFNGFFVDGASINPSAKFINLRQMLFSNAFPTRSVMVRRDIPNRFLGKKFTEDYQLWMEIIFKRGHAYFLDACLAYSHAPEFSVGGYSGQMWVHEKRELSTLSSLHAQGIINFPVWILVSSWSFIKFIRRYASRVFVRSHA
ncbi:glycosyltransferase family 2 protein [Polynucleobacter paneuropaeus]|nr:glycosyltransferase family 2 protein [Polynucleobacter paneuropaeus]